MVIVLLTALLVLSAGSCCLLLWAIIVMRTYQSRWLEANARLAVIWRQTEEANTALLRTSVLVRDVLDLRDVAENGDRCA